MKTNNWFDIIAKYINEAENIEVFIPKVYNLHEKMYIRPVNCVISENGEVNFITADSMNTNVYPGGAAIINIKLF